jgi:hypothetical protein
MCHKVIVKTNHIEGAVHMQVTTVGIDLAKKGFQVHGVDERLRAHRLMESGEHIGKIRPVA